MANQFISTQFSPQRKQPKFSSLPPFCASFSCVSLKPPGARVLLLHHHPLQEQQPSGSVMQKMSSRFAGMFINGRDSTPFTSVCVIVARVNCLALKQSSINYWVCLNNKTWRTKEKKFDTEAGWRYCRKGHQTAHRVA